MSYTMEDFKRELNRKRFMELTSEELWEFWKVQSLEDRRAMLETMPLEYLREILELLPPGGFAPLFPTIDVSPYLIVGKLT